MKQIEFKPPAGLVPEGAAEGTEFEEVATFRVKKNGMVCMVAVGEHQMPGYGGKDSSDSTYEYGERASQKYTEAMEGEM